MEQGNSISVSRLLALPSHKRGGGSGRELAGGLGRPLLAMPGHLPPSWLPHHVLLRRRNSSSHQQLERQGCGSSTPGPSCKTHPRGPGASVGCVVCPTCLSKPSPSPARGGGTGQLSPLRVWRAARRLPLVLPGVVGLSHPWRAHHGAQGHGQV